jgi:uncharacterized membrane-anchored protein
MRKMMVLMSLSALVLITMGCTSNRGYITLNTYPPGAEVYLNDVMKGETPLTFDYDISRTAELKVKKDGYQTLVEELSKGWVVSEAYKGNFNKEYQKTNGSSERVWKVRTTRNLIEK